MEGMIRRVLGHYDLGELRYARRVGRGFVNQNWILETTRGRYFLKRRHPDLRNEEVICAQHQLNKHLRQSGFPSPAILPTKSGETLLVLGDEYFEIQEYIEGSPYQDTIEAHFRAAAITLGIYHACIHGFTPRPHCDLGTLYGPLIVDHNLTSLTDLWALKQDPALRSLLQELEVHAAQLAACFSKHHDLHSLLIHGDYHGSNLLFHGDHVVGVVDYDKASWQPRVAELAEALIYFASSCPVYFKHIAYRGFLDWDKFTTFLRHYSHGISAYEKDSMPLAWSPLRDLPRERDRSSQDISLKEKEVCTLPDYISCIWLAVSLKRLAEKDQCPTAAEEVLRELLDLIDWSSANRQRMMETACRVLVTEN